MKNRGNSRDDKGTATCTHPQALHFSLKLSSAPDWHPPLADVSCYHLRRSVAGSIFTHSSPSRRLTVSMSASTFSLSDLICFLYCA